MSNFFSSPRFLDTAARVFFPRERLRAGTVEVEGRLYDVLLGRRGAPVQIPLVDYLEPRAPADGAPAGVRAVASLPAVARAQVAVTGPEIDAGSFLPAPRIDWSAFTDWDAFTGQCAHRSRNAFKRHARKLAALDAEVGPTRFSLDEPDHALLEVALLWKSRQLRQTQRPDRFASLRNRQFLHLLLDEGQLKLAVLFAGDQALAAELSCRDATRHAAWITSFNVDFSKYSPGILLFERLMQASWEQGHHSFEFLAGGDAYKCNYATHAWLVGPAGTPPFSERTRVRIRTWVADHADTSPARRGAFQAARWVLERRIRGEGLTAITPAAWEEELKLGQPDWPHGRLADPAACPLQALAAWGVRDASLMASWLARTEVTARRAVRVLQGHPGREGTSHEKRAGRSKLSPGDQVRVRSVEQIARAGDGGGARFVPALMGAFVGQTFRVSGRADGAREHGRRAGFPLDRLLLLDGVQCSGARLSCGGRCDRRCALPWREDWLEGAGERSKPVRIG